MDKQNDNMRPFFATCFKGHATEVLYNPTITSNLYKKKKHSALPVHWRQYKLSFGTHILPILYMDCEDTQ